MTNQIDLYESGVGGARDVTYCTTPATTTSTASVTNPCVVIENYRNGASWYRVWSDGWIEQGGINASSANNTGAAITFLKPYSDANYTITFSVQKGARSYADSYDVVCLGRYADKFYASGSWTGTSNGKAYSAYNFSWYACGY